MTETGYYDDSCGWAKKMRIERAKEELEILESQHPNHYQSLKLELKSFISFLQASLSPSPSLCDDATTSTATTQASTTLVGRPSKRKRKREGDKEERGICLEWEAHRESRRETERRSVLLFNNMKEKDATTDRVDLVLRRAHACLTKIRLLKFQLSPS